MAQEEEARGEGEDTEGKKRSRKTRETKIIR
jgi:hypothetical protein